MSFHLALHNTTTLYPPLLDRAESILDPDVYKMYSPYNYLPTRWIAILFLALFGLSTLAHVVQGIYFRVWWTFPTIIVAGILEIIGWSGRLWSSFSPFLFKAFQMQITATILAPTPLVAANFIILGRIIGALGPEYSRLRPRWYTIIFCFCDLISLIVQGVGGGIAAAAVGNYEDPTPGAHIMLGGIIFQMGTITVYATCALEFLYRYFHFRPIQGRSTAILQTRSRNNLQDATQTPGGRGILTPRLKLMILALLFNTLCLYTRAVYRTIELTDGWSGRIISTELYFNVLDGAMIVLAIWTLNFAHPGLLLPLQARASTEEEKAEDFELENGAPSRVS